MIYIIILFLTLILINIVFNIYFIKNKENFQLQPYLNINSLEKSNQYTLYNINQLVKFTNTDINGYTMNGVNSYINLNDKLNDIFTVSLLLSSILVFTFAK